MYDLDEARERAKQQTGQAIADLFRECPLVGYAIGAGILFQILGLVAWWYDSARGLEALVAWLAYLGVAMAILGVAMSYNGRALAYMVAAWLWLTIGVSIFGWLQEATDRYSMLFSLAILGVFIFFWFLYGTFALAAKIEKAEWKVLNLMPRINTYMQVWVFLSILMTTFLHPGRFAGSGWEPGFLFYIFYPGGFLVDSDWFPWEWYTF